VTGRSDPWWLATFTSLRPDLERFFGRRLPVGSVQDLVSTVLEQLVEKSATFATSHPAWLSTTDEPPPGEAAAFIGLVWKIARMRMLDEIRHVYIVRKARSKVEQPEGGSGVDVTAQIDARTMLELLARYVDELTVEDRELLLTAVDGECNENGAQSPAQRVRLHRLRRQLAKRLWNDLNPSKKRGEDT
jgi:hypothetical protein